MVVVVVAMFAGLLLVFVAAVAKPCQAHCHDKVPFLVFGFPTRMVRSGPAVPAYVARLVPAPLVEWRMRFQVAS